MLFERITGVNFVEQCLAQSKHHVSDSYYYKLSVQLLSVWYGISVKEQNCRVKEITSYSNLSITPI